MELRAVQGRALLVGEDGEADPRSLPLKPELADALDEWARVADAVRGSADGANIAELVSQRGRQLAGRVSVVIGVPVGYLDPLTGEVTEPEHGRHRAVSGTHAAPGEPTPWGTGLVVSAFAAAIVLFSVVTLTFALADDSSLLALGANVLVALGLAPSVWLARQVPGWRWLAFGVIGGVFAAWFVLLLSLL